MPRHVLLFLLLPFSGRHTALHSCFGEAFIVIVPIYALFDEDVIKASLTQVKEDSQLKLLLNLSSMKDDKQSASSASSSGHGRSSSIGSRCSKCSTSSSPVRRRSQLFGNRSHVPCLSR